MAAQMAEDRQTNYLTRTVYLPNEMVIGMKRAQRMLLIAVDAVLLCRL